MRNDDDDARREAKADRELREQIRRSIEEEDEREPTLEELEKWTRQMNEEAGDPPPSAQTPPAPTQLPPQTNAASPSADSSRNGKGRGGPSRAEGKAISKTNATTHGIFSSVVVLPNESRTDYAALLKGFSEYFLPEGSPESLLVEKLAMLVWRHRRLLLAEGDELENTVDRRPLRLAVIEHVSVPKRRDADEALFWGITNIAQLRKCIDHLTELRNGIETNGLDPAHDRRILDKIYGIGEGSKGETLYQRYEFWLDNSERDGNLISPPPILDEIDAEIARLTSILEEHDVDAGTRKIIVRRRRHIPDSPAAERLLRYEVTLERAFERTLAQLERLQHIRKGQPVLPRLEVGLSG